ncbi:GrpB family protein [Microbacterium sp. G2-8]|uniref:GrpB family protein n=1 Tax=Microbacterium sp. G2-8 TaxID=2842454 RepID=UPI001C89978D|nr:GrpB family protein [Microbacterium sp. G2-8]
MPSVDDIVTFQHDDPPPGRDPFVIPARPQTIEVADSDPVWPHAYEAVAARIRGVLGARVLQLEHVGSTSVPDLPAKPVIDVDLIVADSADEAAWVPPLVDAGFVLTVREPWWHEHRVMKLEDPAVNLHVFSPDAPEPWKHRILRDHLRRDDGDRERYAGAKRAAARAANEIGETVMQYNARKEAVIREIYERAFHAAGLRRG